MNGVLNLFKPAGITSHAAVSAVRRLYGAPKAGHCGTLDPMAAGVLPVMLGSAVKLSEYTSSTTSATARRSCSASAPTRRTAPAP